MIHSAESSIIFCLLRNSVKPRTSLRCSLQNSCLVLLYEQQFHAPKSKLCHFLDQFLFAIVVRRMQKGLPTTAVNKQLSKLLSKLTLKIGIEVYSDIFFMDQLPINFS